MKSPQNWDDHQGARRARRSMMVLFALCITLPLLALAALGTDQRARMWRDAQRDTESTLTILHKHMRSVFETQELVLDLVEDLVRDLDDSALAERAIGQRLASIVARLDQTVSLWVTDARGDVVAASMPFRPGLNFAEMDFFKAQLSAPQPRFIGGPYTGQLDSNPCLAMSRRRFSRDGRFIGIINVAISPPALEAAFRAGSGTLGGTMGLLREDGLLLVRQPEDQAGRRLGPETALMRAIAQAPQEGIVRDRAPGKGTPRLFAYRRLQPFPLLVVYGADMPARLAAWQRLMLWQAALAGAIMLLLCGAVWFTCRSAAGRSRALAELQQESERRHLLEAQLQEAQSLEALGRMARGVAHDFNNLLTVVIGNLETLEETLPDPALRGVAQRTRRAAEASAQLAASLLAYARTQVLQVETLPMGRLLRDMRPELQELVPPDIELRLQTAPNLPACRVDPALLRASIGNLVRNAVEAIRRLENGAHRGRIMLEAHRVAAPPGEEGIETPLGFVAISVTDNGPGMTPDVAARASEPFFTTKPAGAGMGLGLSQVFGLVTQLDGRMMLHGEAGQGTRVTLYLPVAQAPSLARPLAPPPPDREAAPTPPPPPVSEGPVPGARILVVEDQPEIRAMVDRMLTRAGYRVTLAEGGRAALARLEAGEAFELVLSDLLIPNDMDGLTLAARIRRDWPGTATLLVSGIAPETEALSAAGVGFLHKPFSRQALLEAVRRSLG